MSLHTIASHLATKGRNGDSMLVHMTPEEVGGLQALALSAYGKPLTVNPETGVVEASLLKRLLPTIAGALVGNLVPGAGDWASALVGGVTAGATGGWKLKNIGAGMLGGYSGRELAQRLAGISSAPAATEVKTKPATQGTQAAAAAAPPNTIAPGELGEIPATAPSPAVVAPKAPPAPVTPTFKNMGEGLRRLFTEEKLREQFMKENFLPLAGAFGSYAMLPDAVSGPKQGKQRFWRQRFNPGTKVNPNWQRGQGESYWLDRGWDEGEYVDDPYAFASGGTTHTEQPLKEGDVPVAVQGPAPTPAPAPTQRYYSSDYKSPYHDAIMSYIDDVNTRRRPTTRPGAGTSTGTTTPATGPGTGTPNEGTSGARNDTGVSTGSGTGPGVATGVVPTLPYTPVVSDIPVVNETPARAPDYVSPMTNNGGLAYFLNQATPKYEVPDIVEPIVEAETPGQTPIVDVEDVPDRTFMDYVSGVATAPGDIKAALADAAIKATYDAFSGLTGKKDIVEAETPMLNRALNVGRGIADPLGYLLEGKKNLTDLIQGNAPPPVTNPLVDVAPTTAKSEADLAREALSQTRAALRALREQGLGGPGGAAAAGSGVARAGSGGGRGGWSLPRGIVKIEDVRPGKAAGGMIGHYADGGGISSLGGYSDGGRLLRGPGDGVSDDIPAGIYRNDGSRQEARLADGEFVFPARIVSEIGNGSTEAGAQKLYAIMDRIQRDRSRTLKDVAKDTNAERHFASMMA